uniref:sodium- and chloride-dependent betaine transporter-like n=1 Tax=Styela clava TaxID=7725 RepID=UPI0019393A1C|nr:sodium- and chloride-dependent betaine transporter-like [Styela clava]
MRKQKNAISEKRAITWKKQFDYLFSLLGLMIGLGNVWRFPYLCYKNGGGAFLIAYWACVFVIIFPLITMESALGQLTGQSSFKAWNIVPLTKGIGYAVLFLMFYYNLYYPVLLAWSLRWFVASFSASKPWTTCNNEWNSFNCLPLSEIAIDFNGNSTDQISTNTSSDVVYHNLTYVSSVEEFWENHILDTTADINELGGIKMELLICFTVIWIGTYFAIWKGIEWTSKIVYVTATLPLVMMTIVCIRGVTLEGALDGLEVYLKPDFVSLKRMELWSDAASQVLYSLGTCTGGLTALSAYNKYNHNFFRDSIILTAANAGASFISGLAIFSVLGFLAHTKNTTVTEVAASGPGLVFVAYPTALSLLPLPQFWIALFFLALIFLGYDSMFVYQETFMACLRDISPKLFKKKYSNEVLIAIVVVIMYLAGLPMTTRGGKYVLNIFNSYSVSGWCLYFMAFTEMITIGWLYGGDKMLDDINLMIGYNVPRLWMKISWKYIGPIASLILMINSLVSYQPLKYDQNYVYPVWTNVLGWMTALNSILCVPILAILMLWKAKGDSLLDKLRSTIVPKQFHSRRPVSIDEEPEQKESLNFSCQKNDGNV